MMGINLLEIQLKEMGFETWRHGNNFVVFKFKIPHGRFRDEEIEIALNAPQFPQIPPSGPYIKPFLLPISGGGGSHPLGGIHSRNQPTSEFQYWSRPFAGNTWKISKMNADEYIYFLRTLFDFE